MLFSQKQRYLLRRLLDRTTFIGDETSEHSESGGELYQERIQKDGKFYQELLEMLSHLNFNEPDLRNKRSWRKWSVSPSNPDKREVAIIGSDFNKILIESFLGCRGKESVQNDERGYTRDLLDPRRSNPSQTNYRPQMPGPFEIDVEEQKREDSNGGEQDVITQDLLRQQEQLAQYAALR